MIRLLSRICLFACLLALFVGPAWALEDVRERALQSVATANGDGLVLSLERFSTVAVDVTITGTATVTFEGSTSGGGWTGVGCIATNDIAGTAVLTASTTGMYQCNVAAFAAFHAPISGCASCTVTVFARATTADFSKGGGGGGGGPGGTTLGAIANASAPTKTEGQAVPLSTNLLAGLRVILENLLSCEDQTNTLCRVSGGPVRQDPVMTGVTTNTTSATTILFGGGKTPIARVSGTGAVTATVTLYGDMENTTTNGEFICRIVLSDTTKDVDSCGQFGKDWPYYHAVTTNVTGTGATVEFIVAYGFGGDSTGSLPPKWSCNLTAIGTTLTECQAVPGVGLRLYITDITAQSNTSTAGLFTLRYGTGTNCGTGTGNLFFASASALLAAPANTLLANNITRMTPIVVLANNAICVLGVVTNTTNIQINGYTAP